MSTHQKDRIEKLEQIITKLVEESAKGKPIVVEGKKDAQALRELGVAGAVLMVKSGGKSFLQCTSEIETSGANEVILLLDFDRRGREGTKRLQRNLERTKIKTNIGLWLELRGLVGHDVQCIETLPSYLATAQQKVA